jgi:acyl carrier protein
MADSLQGVIQQLSGIFEDVFDDDSIIVNEDTVAADVDGWDSLAHIRLIVSIEKAFRLRFSAAEIAALQNVGDMAALIQKKLGSK